MSETEIRAAVEAARKMQPRLSAGLADGYIASGKTVEAVKADLVDRMLGTGKQDGPTLARASMVKQIAARFGADAAATAAAETRRPTGVDPKTAIIGTPMPKASSRAADGFTMGQHSMLDVVERTQGKAARAQAEARLTARAG